MGLWQNFILDWEKIDFMLATFYSIIIYHEINNNWSFITHTITVILNHWTKVDFLKSNALK